MAAAARTRSHDFAARRRIQHLVQRRIKKTPAVGRDQHAGKKRRPRIGALPARSADESDRDANESRDRSQRVGAMMPGIGLHRGALGILSQTIDGAKKQFFHDHDDDHEHRKREWRGRVMRSENLAARCAPR